MNTILTDDALIDAIRKAGLRVIGPHKILARAVEAAVLAKLAQQVDRQRVPDGYVLVSKDRLKALSASINGDCYMGEEWEKEAVAAMLAAAPEAPAQNGHLADDERVAALCSLSYAAGMKAGWNYCASEDNEGFERSQKSVGEAVRILKAHRAAAPEAPAQASAVNDDYKGWYCAQCQRGVDGSEVTFREQHEACGRVITDDRPPKAQASAVDERGAKLMAENETKDVLLRQALAVIRWQCFGECRTEGVEGLPTPSEVDIAIREHLNK